MKLLRLLPLFAPLLAGQSSTSLGSCPILPADSIWNTPVDSSPADANSALYVATIGVSKNLHPDFGSGLYNGAPIGIPFVTVPGNQPKVSLKFDYSDESDQGPYPIPANPPIEGGGDAHILIVDRTNCILYELFAARLQTNGSWQAGSGAIFDLRCNCLRPATWTSADAAGLPIFPGLIRYDEVASGEIRHAIRFTAPQTQRAFVWPARHFASSLTAINYPPMGQRFRLKASFDVSRFSPQNQVVLHALKKYGMILSDNGSSWFISGVPDDRWNNETLAELKQVTGDNFEAVDVSSQWLTADSARVANPQPALLPPIRRPPRPR